MLDGTHLSAGHVALDHQLSHGAGLPPPRLLDQWDMFRKLSSVNIALCQYEYELQDRRSNSLDSSHLLTQSCTLSSNPSVFNGNLQCKKSCWSVMAGRQQQLSP